VEAISIPDLDTSSYFVELNTPRASRRSLRPVALIQALSSPAPSSSSSTGSRSSRLFSSREHQDAQELFQILTEAVKEEAIEVAREAGRDIGLGIALSVGSLSPKSSKDRTDSPATGSATPRSERERDVSSLTKSVFDGLTANRRSCVQCGYTEAVMHFSFDSWQLALPRAVSITFF
jgi:ubiquitin carboxyl-terminal hydrolase 1